MRLLRGVEPHDWCAAGAVNPCPHELAAAVLLREAEAGAKRIGLGEQRFGQRAERRRTTGRATIMKVASEETGYPGSPTKAARPTVPRVVGLPGLTAMRQTCTSPSARTASTT